MATNKPPKVYERHIFHYVATPTEDFLNAMKISEIDWVKFFKNTGLKGEKLQACAHYAFLQHIQKVTGISSPELMAKVNEHGFNKTNVIDEVRNDRGELLFKIGVDLDELEKRKK